MPRVSQMRNACRGGSRQPWAKSPPWAPPCSFEDAATAIRDLLSELRSLFDSEEGASSDLAWSELLEKASVAQRLRVTAWAEVLVARDVAVPLLGLVQAVERDPTTLQPFPPPHNSSASLLACKLAREFLHALYRVRAGGIVYRHAITGETTETPRIAGTPWTSVLMQSLPLLAAPGMVKGKVVWAAELVHWSPTINNTLDGKGNVGPKSGDNGAGSDGNNVSKVNPLLAGRPGTGFVLKGDARTTTPVEQNVSSVAVPAEPVDCSDTTTVFDVLTYAESGSGQGSPFSEEFMTLRQLTLGSWRGVNQFVETEADVSRPVGDALDAWYAVTLVGAALASIEWHTHHATMNCTGGQDGVRVPGRQTPPRVLILGLGGGAMASFLARYAPTVHVEVVELRASVAYTAQRYFGLNGQDASDAEQSSIDLLSQNKEVNEEIDDKMKKKEDKREEKKQVEDAAFNVVPASESSFPSSRPCVIHVGDARTFVSEAVDARQTFDAILIDVYSFERFPPDLCTDEFFFLNCKELVAPVQGVVAVNAGCADDPLHQQVLQTITKAFQTTEPKPESDPPPFVSSSSSSSVVAVTELAVEINNGEDHASAQTSSSSSGQPNNNFDNFGSGSQSSNNQSSSTDNARAYESAGLIGRCGSVNADALFSTKAWSVGSDDNTSLAPCNIDDSTCKGSTHSVNSGNSMFLNLPFTLGDVHNNERRHEADIESSSLNNGLEGSALLWQEVDWKPAKQPSLTKVGPEIDPKDSAWNAFGSDDSDSDT